MTKPELIEAVDNLAAKVNKMFIQLKESEMKKERPKTHYVCPNCATKKELSIKKRNVCLNCGESFELEDVK